MRFFLFMLVFLFCGTAKAQAFPAKPIRLVVPFAPGVGSTPAEYAAFVRKEQERWSKVVRAAKIKAD